MSGLAEVLLQEGFTISGSDSQRSELTRHLEEKGATVFYGQTADNIKPGIDVVVYTAAIHPDNAEFAAARSFDYFVINDTVDHAVTEITAIMTAEHCKPDERIAMIDK